MNNTDFLFERNSTCWRQLASWPAVQPALAASVKRPWQGAHYVCSSCRYKADGRCRQESSTHAQDLCQGTVRRREPSVQDVSGLGSQRLSPNLREFGCSCYTDRQRTFLCSAAPAWQRSVAARATLGVACCGRSAVLSYRPQVSGPFDVHSLHLSYIKSTSIRQRRAHPAKLEQPTDAMKSLDGYDRFQGQV